jgi:hypothetical protein
MKVLRFFNLEIQFFFSIMRVKRIELDLSDNADDVGLRESDKSMQGFVCYFLNQTGTRPHFIDLPKHKRAQKVHVTEMYWMNPETKKYERRTGRKIIIDLYN